MTPGDAAFIKPRVAPWVIMADFRLAMSFCSLPGPFADDRASALGTRVLRRAALFRQPVKKGGKQLQVRRRIARAVTEKPGAAVFDVGGITDLRCLAIADNINPRSCLTAHHLGHVIGHAGVKSGRIIVLATFAGEQKIDSSLRAGQRSDVSCKQAHSSRPVAPAGFSVARMR